MSDTTVLRVVHRFRFVNDVAFNTSHRDVRVNFIEYWEVGERKVQHFSWVTDLPASARGTCTTSCGGRARWKIENETWLKIIITAWAGF